MRTAPSARRGSRSSRPTDVSAPAEANCASETYTNGEVAFPPASVLQPWNEVTTKTVEPKYTICGLAFVLALHSYSAYAGTGLQEATTVNNFLRFVTDTSKELEGNKNNGGQTLIKKHDYMPLVGTVLKEAQKGAALTTF